MSCKTGVLFLACFLFLNPAFGAFGGLQAWFHGGKTYLTFTEDTGTGHTYNLYRSLAPITSVNELTPYASIADSSSFHRQLNVHFICRDSGAQLTDTTGIFVYTPKTAAEAYYAVTVVWAGTEDKTILAGDNALAAPVSEQYWPRPIGLLYKTEDYGGWPVYTFQYWMDYDTWPRTQASIDSDFYTGTSIRPEPAGCFFKVTLPAAGQWRGQTKLPVTIHLHGMGSLGWSMPLVYTNPGLITLTVKEHQALWYTNISGERVMACLDAMLTEPRFTSITDTSRVILSGESMGGAGTLDIGFLHPERFSALCPVVAKVVREVYQWNWFYEFGHLAEMASTPSVQRPPMIDAFGTFDYTMSFDIHAHGLLANAVTAAKQGYWAHWIAGGHGVMGVIPQPDTIFPGTAMRFRLNEAFPAFTNCSIDDNYGRYDSSTFDATGFVNRWIDWTSSLHDLGLANDEQVDAADTVAFTFQSLSASFTVDVTPRRLQRFAPVPGNRYFWKNIDVATGSCVAAGIVQADAAGLVTVPGLSVSTTGNRLIITPDKGDKILKVTILDSAFGNAISGAHLILDDPAASSRVSGSDGSACFLTSPRAYSVTASREAFQTRVSLVNVTSDDTTFLTVYLTEKPRTGIRFTPDTKTMGLFSPYDAWAAILCGVHDDSSLYPLTDSVSYSVSPEGVVQVTSGAITAMALGTAQVVAQSLSGFRDTLIITVADTVPVLLSVALEKETFGFDGWGVLKKTGRIALPDDTLLIDGLGNGIYYLFAKGHFRKIDREYDQPAEGSVSWSSLDTSIVSVSGGTVTGKQPGLTAVVAEKDGASDTAWFAVRRMPAVLKRINFQRSYAGFTPWKNGWLADNGQLYSDTAGHGWSQYGSPYERSGITDNFLLMTYLWISAPRDFRVQVPDGNYLVRVCIGAGPNDIPGACWLIGTSDTLVSKPVNALPGWETRTRAVSTSGGRGLEVTAVGDICYLVIASDEGIPMDSLADDEDNSLALNTPGETPLPEKPVTAAALCAFPNPFNPSVNIAYAVPGNNPAYYRIFDVRGRCVFSRPIPAGQRGARGTIVWNGRDGRNTPAASGVYIGRMTITSGKTLTHKLLLFK